MAKRTADSEEQEMVSDYSELEEGEIREEGRPHKQRKTTNATHAGGKTLMGLPPELRNHIYRYALLVSGGVRIDATNHDEPPLLQTCRQVRKEASDIYRRENQFEFQVHDLRMDVPSIHWAQHLPLDVRKMRFTGKRSWTNLLQWLERYHAPSKGEKCLGIGGNPSSRPLAVIGRPFRMVEVLMGTPWPTVKKVLEQYRETVVEMDGSWTWED